MNMNTTTVIRRLVLLSLARQLAGRARRARLTATLQQIRDVGAQLDALNPFTPEAPDVLNAARLILDRKLNTLDRIGA